MDGPGSPATSTARYERLEVAGAGQEPGMDRGRKGFTWSGLEELTSLADQIECDLFQISYIIEIL